MLLTPGVRDRRGLLVSGHGAVDRKELIYDYIPRMQISLHQINTTVADFSGNVGKIVSLAGKARESGSSLAIFPELSLTGYPPLDLLTNPNFTRRSADALQSLIAQTAGLGLSLLVGTILPSNTPGEGKPLHNSAVLIKGGRVLGIHRKVLLPTYDVFDESRYFEPGRELSLFELEGWKAGVSICEDAWNDKTFWLTRQYHLDPVEEFLSSNPAPLINIAASPFSRGKGHLRMEMLANIARRFKTPVIYVNQVGGNDSLVFDGRSLVMDESGRVVALGKGFEEDMLLIDLLNLPSPVTSIPDMDGTEAVYKALVSGLGDYAAKCGFPSAVLGLSGGIDSSLTAAVAADAMGPENVLGILMSSPFTSPESVTDAETLAYNLKIKTKTIDISNIYTSYLNELSDGLEGLPGNATEENIQARIRGNILMALSNRFGHLVLSTGNKSELATGYCTLYGDMSGGLAVISDLYKGEV
ncbi:MAG TPA: NAD+ synthase, partial [Proteobacteria bacterium]|nr:NAD+ synthase [Pseudomonadota bacterium]